MARLGCNVEIMAAGCVGKALYLALRISQLAPSAYFPLIYGNYSGGSLGEGGGVSWKRTGANFEKLKHCPLADI